MPQFKTPMNPPRFLIWSLEHNAWWGPQSHGYTKCFKDAGRYTCDEAVEIVASANFRSGNTPNEAMVPEPKEML